METTVTPQQYKQPSRKGKNAWRKNVDITEIQEGLEAARDELIKGYDSFKLPGNSLKKDYLFECRI